MKYFLLVAIIFSFISCKKESNVLPVVEDSYVGTYTSVSGDTAYVTMSEDTNYTVIRWCAIGNQAKINFDSVRVVPDLTFTVNQSVEYFGEKTGIGSGSFSENAVSFNFVVGGNGNISFSGIKK